MAYSTSNPPQLFGQAIAGTRSWRYVSTDSSTDIDDAGFFTNGYSLGMRVGDSLICIKTDSSYAQTFHVVTVATSTGVTVSAGST